MKAKKILALFIASLAIVYTVYTPARAELRVAAAGPMTGRHAAVGKYVINGAELAVKHLNAKGGVLGQKLVLELGDDSCDPKQAVAVANQMVNKGVVFVAGHFCSGSSIPASDVYHEEDILMMSPASTAPEFTDRGLGNVFRVCGRDDQQGVVAGQFIARRYADQRVAIVHDKSTYGKGLADVVTRTIKQEGLQPALRDSITAGEKDFSALVSKLKAQKVDAIFFGGYENEAGLIVRQMRAQGLSTRMISGDSLVSRDFWAITGDAGEGTVLTFSVDPRQNPRAPDVVAEYRAQGIDPEAFTLYTYAALQVWAQAAERVGSVETSKVAKALKSHSFDTVLGELGFDAKGDVKAPSYVLYEWKDGQYDYFKE